MDHRARIHTLLASPEPQATSQQADLCRESGGLFFLTQQVRELSGRKPSPILPTLGSSDTTALESCSGALLTHPTHPEQRPALPSLIWGAGKGTHLLC